MLKLFRKRAETAEMPYGMQVSSNIDDGILFSWKKPGKAIGYEVFRSYEKEGEYVSLAMIDDRNVSDYRDADFDHSRKQVFYKVRSYNPDESGTIRYSSLTEAVVAEFRDSMEIERPITYMYSGLQRPIRAFFGWGEVRNAEWKSDDENIATIDSRGIITAVAKGRCTISCFSDELGRSVSSVVEVDREAPGPKGPLEGRYSFNPETGFWKNQAGTDSGRATLMMVGDMMCGSTQIRTQWNEEDGWNFNPSYEYVKEITADSDFAIGNLETLLASGWPYMSDEFSVDGKNNCNAPVRYLDAVRAGGFDALATANNHNCDGGVPALKETIRQIEKYGFANTGVFADEKQKRFFIADINGIKVGFLAYTTKHIGFNGKNREWSRHDRDSRLNLFEAEKAAEDIRQCREAGAEYIITYMHWGRKNHFSTIPQQEQLATEVANAGTDFIVGANPHVLQPYEVIEAEDGRKVPCYYSLGNFQASMNQIKGNKDSVLVRITLEKDEQDRVVLRDNVYIPCFCYRKIGDNDWATVSLSEKYNGNVPKENGDKIAKRIAETIGETAIEI